MRNNKLPRVPLTPIASSRALLPIAKIAAKTGSGKWVCKKCERDFGRDVEHLSRTHVENHEKSLQHRWGQQLVHSLCKRAAVNATLDVLVP